MRSTPVGTSSKRSTSLVGDGDLITLPHRRLYDLPCPTPTTPPASPYPHTTTSTPTPTHSFPPRVCVHHVPGTPSHAARFLNNLTDRDQMQLELANDSVHSSTEKVGSGTRHVYTGAQPRTEQVVLGGSGCREARRLGSWG